jgi:hypothetical protein
MNLDEFSTKDNANSGVWTELSLYGKNTGVEICIRGNDSDVVQKFNREEIKKIRVSAEKTELDDEAIDDGVLVRIAGIRSKNPDDPIVLLDKTIGNDEKSLRFLIEKIPAVKEFVLRIAGDRKNFLSKPKAA